MWRLADKVSALRQLVEERLRALDVQMSALADANVHGAELLERVEAFGQEVHAQNEALRSHAARLEASEREASRLVDALAAANVAAVMSMEQIDAEREDALAAQCATQLERAGLAREAEELRRQSAALAEANVEMLVLAEAQDEEVEELRARCEREHAEKLAFREQALVDRLTGLFNRRYYEDQLEREYMRARRFQRELSVVFFDIDHFKAFNDTHGHAAGDVLLALVASTVQSGVRQVDIVTRVDGTPFAARYGGEEFIVILPETGVAGALLVAERIRNAVATTVFGGGERQPGGRVTVSAGVASLGASDASGAGVAQRADAALYRAKQAGRNTVIEAEPSGEPVAA